MELDHWTKFVCTIILIVSILFLAIIPAYHIDFNIFLLLQWYGFFIGIFVDLFSLVGIFFPQKYTKPILEKLKEEGKKTRKEVVDSKKEILSAIEKIDPSKGLVLEIEGKPEASADDVLGGFKHLIEKIPTTVEDLHSYFSDEKGTNIQCDNLMTMISIFEGLNDTRLKALLNLYDLHCNGLYHFIMGTYQAKRKNFQESIKELEKALKIIGQKMKYAVLNNLAVSIVRNPLISSKHKAGILFREAVSLEERSYVIWRNYGVWALETWQETDWYQLRNSAINAFETAIMLNRNYAAAYVSMGALYVFSKDYKEAIEYMERGLEIQPENLKALANLGLIYNRRRNFKKSKEYLWKSISINPDYDMGWGGLGDVELARGHLRNAEEAYQKALASENPTPTFARHAVYSNLGIIYERRGNYQSAVEFHKEAIKEKRNFANAWYNLGVVLMKIGRQNEAAEAYNEVLMIDPNNTKTIYNLGYIYEEDREKMKAIDMYRRAIKSNPRYFLAHAQLGRLLLSMEHYEKAEEEFRIALKIRPKDKKLWYHIRLLLQRTKRESLRLPEIRSEIFTLIEIQSLAPDNIDMEKPWPLAKSIKVMAIQ